jgi:hypothetical protein
MIKKDRKRLKLLLLSQRKASRFGQNGKEGKKQKGKNLKRKNEKQSIHKCSMNKN